MPDEKKKRQKRVVIFTTPACTYCNSAKMYFRQNKVRFKEVDVSRDQQAAKYMQRRSKQTGVPVIEIGSRIIVGFDRLKIDRLLELR